MPVSDLSTVAQDYLKVIWSATEWSDDPGHRQAARPNASACAPRPSPTASGGSPTRGCVVHEPYGAIELTEAGRRHAVAMVRRHRLIETFLVEELGYGWDEVHDEAEVLEHAVSDDAGRAHRPPARLPGARPARRPHPDRRRHAAPAGCGAAARRRRRRPPARVVRISDADPAVLRYLGRTRHRARHRADRRTSTAPFAGDVTVRVGGARARARRDRGRAPSGSRAA